MSSSHAVTCSSMEYYTDSQFDLDESFAVDDSFIEEFMKLCNDHNLAISDQYAINTYTNGKLDKAKNKTLQDFSQSREEFIKYSKTDGPLAPFLHKHYDIAYQGYYRYAYNTPSKPSGTRSGGWFEDFQKPMLREAAIRANRPDLIIGRKKSKTGEDHDVFLGESKADIQISIEAKFQSDGGSLKKGLGSMVKNQRTGTSEHGCIVFPTDKVFHEMNRGTAIRTFINEWSMSEVEATTIVNHIADNGQRGGAFKVDNYLSILILGENVPEYSTYLPYHKTGKYEYHNHGGTTGWTLHDSAINSIVDYLVQLLDNKEYIQLEKINCHIKKEF